MATATEGDFFDGWNFDKVLDLTVKTVDKYNETKAVNTSAKSVNNEAANIARLQYADSVQANNAAFSLQSMDSNKKLMIGGAVAAAIIIALIVK